MGIWSTIGDVAKESVGHLKKIPIVGGIAGNLKSSANLIASKGVGTAAQEVNNTVAEHIMGGVRKGIMWGGAAGAAKGAYDYSQGEGSVGGIIGGAVKGGLMGGMVGGFCKVGTNRGFNQLSEKLARY